MNKSCTRVSFLILLVMSLQLILSIFVNSSFAASPLTKRIYINFDSFTANASQKEYVHSESTKTFTFKLDELVKGEIKSWKLIVNSVDKSSIANLQGYNLIVNNLQGQLGTFYGQQKTNPGHHIYRLPSGTGWEHRGKYTPIMQFDADSSTYEGKGYSQYPGIIPTQGRVKGSTALITYPDDLRYDGTKGIAPNWNGYGAGVTASYDPIPPSMFYRNKRDYLNNSQDTVSLSRLDNATIRIVGGYAKQDLFSNDVIPYDWGRTSNGENYIKIFRKFDNFPIEGLDYLRTPDPTGEPYGEDRNYLMEIQTEWTANAYFYSGYIDVTYQEIDKPDLVAVDIVPSVSCFQNGDTVIFEYQLRNMGPDTSIPFKVEIRADGALIKTDDWTEAAGGVGLGRSFSYKFTSPLSKSITIHLDSNDVIDEQSESNNTITKVFSPQASCGSIAKPEVISGEFTLEKSRLKFGENNSINLVNISASGGDGCAYLNSEAKFTQGTNSLVTTTNGKVFAFNGIPYPKGMGIGTVYVSVSIKTTCGTSKDLGSKSFEIYIDYSSPNSPPVFEAGFVQRGNVNAAQPLVNVTVGTLVDLQILHTPAIPPDQKATPYDPDGDPFIYSWDFENTDAAWVKAKYEGAGWWQHDERYSFFIPDQLGTFHIKVTAIDYRGASSTRTVTLNVIPPNPIPIITVPPKIVEGRPFTPDISGANSYSPFGYSIVKYIWGNKQTVYSTAGVENVTLDVVDSNGLHALHPAATQVNILPDLPPIIDVALPSIAIRNAASNFIDHTYSPDGDTIITHTDTIACDVNQNGQFFDDPVTIITLDAAGAFQFTASVVGNCRLYVYAKEDWGKEVSKHFDFKVVNQQPSVQASITGEQPNPPNITTIKYQAKDLLDITNFNVDDFSHASRYSGFYYDAMEDALAAPDRTDMLYLAPQNNEIVADTNMLSMTSYTGENAFLPDFGITNRASEHVWYNQAVDDGCESGWCYPSNPVNLFMFNDKTQTITNLKAPTAPGSYFGGTGLFYMNPEQNTVSFMAYPGCAERYRYENTPAPWDQYTYRFSSLVNGAFTPLSKTSGTFSMFNCKSGPFPQPQSPYQDRPNPLHASSTVPFNLEVNGEKSTNSEFIMPQATDRRGNFYATFLHIQDLGEGASIYNIQLEKFDSSGQLMWRSPKVVSKNVNFGDPGRPQIVVKYTTLNDSKIVTNDGIYDNHSGAFIGTLPQSNSYTNVIQIYNDMVYYADINQKHTLYNLNTGAVITMPNRGQISSDGKFVSFNSASMNIEVADIFTGNLLYTLPLHAPSGFNNYINSKSGIGIFMTGDGKYKVSRSEKASSSRTAYQVFGVSTTPQDKAPASSYSYGNITDRNQTFFDGNLYLSMKYARDSYSEYSGAGISFRVQDYKNMYRAELTTKGVMLSKIVDGVKTILDKQTNPLLFGQYNTLKVQAKADRIVVYMNGVPFINVKDSAFSSGKIGLYAEAPNVWLKGFRSEIYNADATRTANTVIVGSEIQYDSTYSDPEKDPPIPTLTAWTYTNTAPEKFLDAGDGHSDTNATNSYVNYKSTGTVPTLNKVGAFKIDYAETDDPAPAAYRYPNALYQIFRMTSDPATNLLIVHRQPVALFTAGQSADHTIVYDDQSYDPDRWLSPVRFSKEKADYGINRGIYQQRFSYTTPSGDYYEGKMVRPSETGTYTLRQAVADEYGAWSNWHEVELYVDELPVNHPPTVVLTFPTGTISEPTHVTSLTPQITWNQDDPDIATTFTQARILVKDEQGQAVLDRSYQMNTTSRNGSWLVDTALESGRKYQVQVMVADDGGSWSSWSDAGWMVTNRPPAAVMLIPSGTQEVPTIFDSVRPTFQWHQTDPDADTEFSYFQLQITNEANDTLILDSGQHWQKSKSSLGTWTAVKELPAGQKLRVRVRVYDGYAWSGYSEQTWFYINRAPAADFDWSPKPVWEGDTVQFHNTSYDADGDDLTYEWRVLGPDASVQTYTSRNFLRLFQPGSYQVTLTVSDGYLQSTAVKTVVVSPLGIHADVNYTEEWRKLHEEMGHQTEQHPKAFYSGEIFVVSLNSSPAPVDHVMAWMDTTALDGQSLYVWESLMESAEDATSFYGELFDPKFQSYSEGLPPGTQVVHFQIRYQNGVVKTADVPVQIIGNVHQSVGVHRVQ